MTTLRPPSAPRPPHGPGPSAPFLTSTPILREAGTPCCGGPSLCCRRVATLLPAPSIRRAAGSVWCSRLVLWGVHGGGWRHMEWVPEGVELQRPDPASCPLGCLGRGHRRFALQTSQCPPPPLLFIPNTSSQSSRTRTPPPKALASRFLSTHCVPDA